MSARAHDHGCPAADRGLRRTRRPAGTDRADGSTRRPPIPYASPAGRAHADAEHCSCRRGRRPPGRTALADLPFSEGSKSGSVSLELQAKVHGLTTMSVRAAVDVSGARRSGRRPRLPRIRPETLEAPDLVEIGAKKAAQDGRRGPPDGRGGGWAPLAPNNRSLARPCPSGGAFGHRGRPPSTCPA